MSNENPDDKALSPTPGQPPVPAEIPLTPMASLNLSWLPEAQRRALLADYAKGTLDIALRAQELHVDVEALRATVTTLAAQTQQLSEGGQAVTMSQTVENKLGRTEIIMGNTDQAQRGRLTRSQSGGTDMTPYYFGATLLAVVIVLIAVATRL